MGNVAARAAAAAAGDADALARMRGRRPAEQVVWLAVDDEQAEAFRTTERETLAARLGRDDLARADATRLLADARRELEATGAVRFRLRSRGRKRYDDLLTSADCRPADEDHRRVREELGQPSARARYKADTFPFELIALACVEPAGLTASDLREWVDDGRMSQGELLALFQAADQVHTGNRVLDLGK